MNFKDSADLLRKLSHKISAREYSQNENYDTLQKELNETYLNVLESSITEKKCFSSSPLDIYILQLNQTLECQEKESIDFDEVQFLKKEYLIQSKILNTNRGTVISPFYRSALNDENYNLFCSILIKRINYLEKLLFKKGIEVLVNKPYPEESRVNVEFKNHINIMVENDNLQPIKPTGKTKQNKSLLFEGKELNLSERFKIANKVLGLDTKIRKLNIQDLEKYQLLAFILGCDKDNARNLMNRRYNSKDRDLSTYYNDLGLDK